IGCLHPRDGSRLVRSPVELAWSGFHGIVIDRQVVDEWRIVENLHRTRRNRINLVSLGKTLIGLRIAEGAMNLICQQITAVRRGSKARENTGLANVLQWAAGQLEHRHLRKSAVFEDSLIP